MSELREKVKLAIFHEVIGRDLRIVDSAHDQSEQAADAVIAIVIEEAAKVAESLLYDCDDVRDIASCEAAAAAIRALK